MGKRIKTDDFKSATNEKFIGKEIDILEKNKKFFSVNQKYIDQMLEIINGESNISIRVLDWFVSNYSKKYDTKYIISINRKQEIFYVNNEYKNQLNGYSKNYFDPFCRSKKIIYTYVNKNDNCTINFVSSIGQLNFFQWAIRNKIIMYVKLHIKEIEKDMKETTKKTRELKLEALTNSNSNNSQEDDAIIDHRPDPVICSSEKINSVYITPTKKVKVTKSDSETKRKRHQLSKSVYDYGIKKSNIPLILDFD